MRFYIVIIKILYYPSFKILILDNCLKVCLNAQQRGAFYGSIKAQ